MLKVYLCDKNASDLLFTARVAMGLTNGRNVEGEFTGRLVIADPQTASPKLLLYQVWGVSIIYCRMNYYTNVALGYIGPCERTSRRLSTA